MLRIKSINKSWEFHLRAFAKDRSVLMYECLGQGPKNPHVDSFDDVSMKVHTEDFHKVVSTVFPVNIRVDVVGFSFGGRVALSVASIYPHLIKRMHLTGVPAERDGYSRLIFQSWEECLKSGGLGAFAWSTLLSTYSRDFLIKNEGRLPSWIDFIKNQNTVEGLYSIIHQTHSENSIKPAMRVREYNIPVRLVAGSDDLVATPNEVRRLNEILQNDVDVKIFGNAGHAVPLECAIKWRRDVNSFLQ